MAKTLLATCFCLLLATMLGCGTDPENIGRVVDVWGRRGISNGRLLKPRAMAIDRRDRLYTVDMTARVQVFDTQGEFLRGWPTPAHKAGKPTGLSIGIDGNLLLADTHYYRVLIYTPEGKLIKTIGGTYGQGPGEFGMVTDVVQDSQGNYYVGEKGGNDRIQKFSPDGEFLLQWGSPGTAPGQFALPQSLAVDQDDRIWVVDACNHRIQVFDTEGNLLSVWGKQGRGLGELYYPYDLVIAPDRTVYVCEYGNHRLQKFTPDGRSSGCWGTHGRGEDQLNNPWALVRDSHGRIYVLDTNNHRVQCVKI
jgi:sugar lactone lactonase YvrE